MPAYYSMFPACQTFCDKIVPHLLTMVDKLTPACQALHTTGCYNNTQKYEEA
jgi:hypothetical protein